MKFSFELFDLIDSTDRYLLLKETENCRDKLNQLLGKKLYWGGEPNKVKLAQQVVLLLYLEFNQIYTEIVETVETLPAKKWQEISDFLDKRKINRSEIFQDDVDFRYLSTQEKITLVLFYEKPLIYTKVIAELQAIACKN